MPDSKNIQKFIPFTKVDSVKREVSGIVTAEQPDKDREVCDYEKSKPYYKAWSDEFQKTTDGKSLGNLREMHQLSAVGKGTDLQFHDDDKEIVMTFKVVDDDAWKKVEERVYTGFSQGGRKIGDAIADPVFKGCVRYVASPTEVSLVDNPCLPSAHFAYVKADGSVEMRKFLKTEVPEEINRIAVLEQQVNELQKAAGGKVTIINDNAVITKTKKVAGKDLLVSSFAYVGDVEKTETWRLAVDTPGRVRKAFAVFGAQVPASEKAKVRAKISLAAKALGVDLNNEIDKLTAIKAQIRKATRVYVNTHSSIASVNLSNLDFDLGKIAKGMWEVSRLAMCLEEMACMVYCVAAEQDYELDEDSELPEMLAENVNGLTETFVRMVDEETKELLANVKQRVA